MNAFELLSQLYRLLADVDAETIAEARHVAKDGPTLQILDAMEAALSASTTRRDARQPPSKPNSGQATNRNWRLRFLLDGPYRPTREQLIQIFKGTKLNVPIRSKDSSTRIVLRAERALAALSPEAADRYVWRLRRELGINETEGWINVIRNP